MFKWVGRPCQETGKQWLNECKVFRRTERKDTPKKEYIMQMKLNSFTLTQTQRSNLKVEKYVSGKKETKTLLTMLICANMSWTDKKRSPNWTISQASVITSSAGPVTFVCCNRYSPYAGTKKKDTLFFNSFHLHVYCLQMSEVIFAFLLAIYSRFFTFLKHRGLLYLFLGFCGWSLMYNRNFWR